MDDAKAVEVLRRLVKQRAESIVGFRSAGREEQAAAEEAEKALIETFLPKLADAEQTEAWVKEAIAAVSATKPGDAGKVMGAVNKARPGRSGMVRRLTPGRRLPFVQAHKGEVDNVLLKSVVEKLLS